MRTRIVRRFFKIFYAVLTRLEVSGLENVPAAEAYILATNHMSYFDPPLLYSLISNDQIAGFVADKYRKNLIFGSIVRLANPIFIRRGTIDRQALDAAVQILQAGRPFALAPEGTRSKSGSLSRGKTGIALLADLSKAPILLVALTGTDKAFRELLRWRRPKLTVQFAPLFYLPPLDVRDRSESLRRNADEVMCRLAAMLPESYRGAYANHPRLQEFLPEYSSLRE